MRLNSIGVMLPKTTRFAGNGRDRDDIDEIARTRAGAVNDNVGENGIFLPGTLTMEALSGASGDAELAGIIAQHPNKTRIEDLAAMLAAQAGI